MRVLRIQVTKNDNTTEDFIELHDDKGQSFVRLTPVRARNLAKKILKVCEELKGETND